MGTWKQGIDYLKGKDTLLLRKYTKYTGKAKKKRIKSETPSQLGCSMTRFQIGLYFL